MTIIKIPTVNDHYTGHVTECKEVTGKFGEQVCFSFANGDQLFMPLTSATNQLVRCGFDGGGSPPRANLVSVPGNTLAFSRTANKTPGASPYYNIAVATGPAPSPSKRIQGPAGVPGDAPKGWPDAPPPDDKDAPPAEDYPVADSGDDRAANGQPDGKEGHRQALWEAIERAYVWALDAAGRSQVEAFNVYGEIKPTAETIQAGAATLLIQAEKMGAIR